MRHICLQEVSISGGSTVLGRGKGQTGIYKKAKCVNLILFDFMEEFNIARLLGPKGLNDYGVCWNYPKKMFINCKVFVS